MKKSALVAFVFLYTSVFAVEGYKDIYVQSDKDIYVHTIYCGKDLSSLSQLRASVVYTNTQSIEKGTYYINSLVGEYSTTFNKVKGESNSIRIRGILTNGQTTEAQMKKEVCLVEKNSKLPKALNHKITQDIIKSDDPQWNKKMKGLTNYFGIPAYAKGKYLSTK